MIDGYLLQLGECVPRSRIEAIYHRVIGPPPGIYGARCIQHRVYSVPGPMALLHHEGQHGMFRYAVGFSHFISFSTTGLIQWKIVIHAFVDGFSRFVLGIHANNNNCAETVVQLFEDIAQIYGYPSRVRGDHGTENLLVAAQMEEVCGLERASYIWGR